MRPDVGKALLGGFLGTAVMTGMMYWVAPLMLPGPMDIAGMLGGMLSVSWTVGMVIHFVNGTVIFSLVYALVLYGVLPGQPWMKGSLWGIALWVLAGLLIMPMAGAGVFWTNVGGAMPAMLSLVGHVVYGAILGAVAGRGGQGARSRPHEAPTG